MPLLRGDFLSTLRKQIVGKVQLYALKVLADRSAVLDGDGNEQVTELEVVDGKLRSQPESRYQELGLVLEGLNMAAGAFAYSAEITDLEWVRNMIVISQSDQQYDYGVYRGDSSVTPDQGGQSAIATAQSAIGPTGWRNQAFTGASALLGKKVKFFLKNTSTSANTFGRLRVQLLGL